MSGQDLTKIFLVVWATVPLAWTYAMYRLVGPEATISRVLLGTVIEYPIVGVVIGILFGFAMGHIFLYQVLLRD